MSSDYQKTFSARTSEVLAEGRDVSYAAGMAHLEYLLAIPWPTDWGDDYQVLLYGDFDPPAKDLEFPSLGIRVLADPIEGSVIATAKTVLAARISIKERSVAEIANATRRVNILIGTWTLLTWGNASIAWWSHLSHGSVGLYGVPIDHEYFDPALAQIGKFQPNVRRRIEAALFWIREPGRMMGEHQRSNLLRKYSAYWNSFECLVDAICILRPPTGTLSKVQKKAAVNKYVEERGGSLTPRDVQECYHSIVNPGLVGKARNAFTECFGSKGELYIEKCFTQPIKADRLYNVRNAINHGEIDAENPEELLSVEDCLSQLFIIVWGMFGHLIPFPYPRDPAVEKPSESPSSGTPA